MKKVANFFVLFLGFMSCATAQNQPVKSTESYENAKQALQQTLKGMQSSYPDQKTFAMIMEALQRPQSPMSIRLDDKFNPLSSVWMNNGPKMFNSTALKNTVLLPGNFFQMPQCSQALIIEISGLMLNFNQELAKNQEIFQLVAALTNPNDNPDPSYDELKKIASTLPLLEKFIYEHLPNVADTAFGFCTVSEIRGIFALATDNDDKDSWIAAARDKVRSEIRFMEIELGQ